MGMVDADNKPDLIDTLERRIGIDWDIHEGELIIEGTLNADDLAERGIDAASLAEQVSLDETLTLSPDEPLSKQAFLSVLWDLSVPEHASFSVSMEVDKNE